MPKIPVGSQIFDVVFHPTHSTVYTGLLNGYVKAFAYDEQGNHKSVFSLRPSKKSCRGLCLDQDGSHLYAVGKGKSLNTIDTTTEAVDIRTKAHDSTINRVKYLMPRLLATGDDDGIIKLWDPRQTDSVRSYSHHFDYITDFLWLEDSRQLVATSGDGTLSVMDVRSKKSSPVSHSEDQEDELLSIVAIKGGTKAVVGTQLGILSIFNRDSGWGDCVDRIPGHPLSVDALCSLPPHFPDVDTQSIVLTGSSDGLVRAVQILPTKLLGVVTDHGEWAIERVAIGGGHDQITIDLPESMHGGSQIGSRSRPRDEEISGALRRKWWVGSAGHDEVLHLTDLEGFFHENKNEELAGSMEAFGVVGDDTSDMEDHGQDDGQHVDLDPQQHDITVSNNQKATSVEQSPESTPPPKKRKREEKTAGKRKKGKSNAVVVHGSFFDEL